MDAEILVIGGTSGIGRATVRHLVERGRSIGVLARNEPEESLGESVEFMKCDVLSEEGEALTAPDTLSGVVYCPGSITLKPFEHTSEEQFHRDWEINVKGAIRVLRQAAPSLKAFDGVSNVLLFSTVAAQVGMKYHASIASAKGALEGLVRSLAAEWAPSVTVNALAPTLTETPLASDLLDSETRREQALERHPTKEINDSEDVGRLAASILAGELNVTGQIFPVDGGLSAVAPE
jgi:NAD(P)-dependent dehydrogenase (short-subunit alcohol dehydrogenase family)